MMTKHIAGCIAVLALAVSIGTAPAGAQNDNARVVVPDRPQGAVVSGCYRADRHLYGPYNFAFCLKKKGTYKVRGNGLACDGRIGWQVNGRDVLIDVRRASCSRNRAWAAASVTCRALSPLETILMRLLADDDEVGALRCTYDPSVPGEPRRKFVATRL